MLILDFTGDLLSHVVNSLAGDLHALSSLLAHVSHDFTVSLIVLALHVFDAAGVLSLSAADLPVGLHEALHDLAISTADGVLHLFKLVLHLQSQRVGLHLGPLGTNSLHVFKLELLHLLLEFLHLGLNLFHGLFDDSSQFLRILLHSLTNI